MTIEEKIQKILDNASSCHYRIEQVIAIVSSSETSIPGGMANWLRKIGVDDPRIEQALEKALSQETRAVMFRGLMEKYCLNNQAAAAMLGCSAATIASYRTGRREIPIRRLQLLESIIESIRATRAKFSL